MVSFAISGPKELWFGLKKLHSYTDLKINSTQVAYNVRNFCSTQIHMKRHTCSLYTANIKEASCWVSTILKVLPWNDFFKVEYCEMVLLCGECGGKARSAPWLYRERFPAGPYPSYQTIPSVMKRLKETVA